MKRIVFIHPFLLHFHYPRLDALAVECERGGITLHSIQLAGRTQAYESLFDRAKAQPHNICLFPDEDLFSVPSRLMRSALKKALEDAQPDVVFVYGYSLGIMRWAKSWATRNGVASVLISDSNYADKRRVAPLEWLKAALINRFGAAFVGGQSSIRYLEHLGFPKERIAVGYDVVDNEIFRSLSWQHRQSISEVRRQLGLPEEFFLFVGRMLKCKNVATLIRSYAEYVRRFNGAPWGLVLCGDGPDQAEFRRLAAEQGPEICEHISFRGLVRQPALISFYAAASCLILPSTSESWGLAVNEALACGLPVIVSDRCGCALDLVENDVNGWQFNPMDALGLTARMLQVHEIGSIARAAMGRHGEEIVSKWGLHRFCSGALQSASMAMQQASHIKANKS